MDDMTIKDKIKNSRFAAADLSKSFPGALFSQKKRFFNENSPELSPEATSKRKLSLLSDTDDDLKPLNWLVSPNLLHDVCSGRPQVTKPPPPKRISRPDLNLTKSWKLMSQSEVTREQLVKPSIRFLQHRPTHHKIEHETYPKRMDMNKFTKPPYSFATLIFMALEASPIRRLRVKDIYQWIMDKFPYYRLCDRGWKNSVRHNLSLNRCFKRIDKDRRFECGKGSWWMLDPELRPELVHAFKKLGNVNMISASLGTENMTPPQSPPFHTPPSSPVDIFSAPGIDEQTAAAALCLMKGNPAQSGRPNNTAINHGNTGYHGNNRYHGNTTPAHSSGPSSSESSPEQLPPLVRDDQFPIRKRSIIIDKKSAEGVWALLSMANGR